MGIPRPFDTGRLDSKGRIVRESGTTIQAAGHIDLGESLDADTVTPALRRAWSMCEGTDPYPPETLVVVSDGHPDSERAAVVVSDDGPTLTLRYPPDSEHCITERDQVAPAGLGLIESGVTMTPLLERRSAVARRDLLNAASELNAFEMSTEWEHSIQDRHQTLTGASIDADDCSGLVQAAERSLLEPMLTEGPLPVAAKELRVLLDARTAASRSYREALMESSQIRGAVQLLG